MKKNSKWNTVYFIFENNSFLKVMKAISYLIKLEYRIFDSSIRHQWELLLSKKSHATKGQSNNDI